MTNNLRDVIDDILYFGDDKSVAEVKRLISAEKRADYLQEEVLRLRKQRSKDPEFQWGPHEGREELHYYLWGQARLGYCYNSGRAWWTYVAVIPNPMVGGPFPSKKAAHDAVELAVRIALGRSE